jgi:hypothetical protein
LIVLSILGISYGAIGKEWIRQRGVLSRVGASKRAIDIVIRRALGVLRGIGDKVCDYKLLFLEEFLVM